jgi:hypothetical protein
MDNSPSANIAGGRDFSVSSILWGRQGSGVLARAIPHGRNGKNGKSVEEHRFRRAARTVCCSSLEQRIGEYLAKSSGN